MTMNQERPNSRIDYLVPRASLLVPDYKTDPGNEVAISIFVTPYARELGMSTEVIIPCSSTPNEKSTVILMDH